jgi:hypothetical protein
MLLPAARRRAIAGCSPQIPAAARMLGINPSTSVQVALVKIPRAGRGRGPRHRTPTAIRIGGINPSAPVQIAPVIILAAGLSVGCTYVRRHRDHSYRQSGQEPEDPKAHHSISLSAPGGGYHPNHVIGGFVPLPVCCYTSAPLVQTKKLHACQFDGRQPSFSEHDVQNGTRRLGVGWVINFIQTPLISERTISVRFVKIGVALAPSSIVAIPMAAILEAEGASGDVGIRTRGVAD